MEISSMGHVAVDVPEDDDSTSIIERLKTEMDDRAKARSTRQRPTIYRVPDVLRKLDPDAYEPQVISLGPYHHGKPHLKSMDEIKWQYLSSFLRRNPSVGLDRYVCQVKKLESRMRHAYSEAPPYEAKAFIEMMLLDACFVLEFLFGEVPTASDNGWDIALVHLDMLRLENQIPFFLLGELLQLNCPTGTRSLTETIYDEFFHLMPGKIKFPSTDLDRYHHILHLLVSCAAPHLEQAKQAELERARSVRSEWARRVRSQRVTRLKSASVVLPHSRAARALRSATITVGKIDESPKPREPTLEWVPCARRLHESGVVFRRKEKRKYQSFLDITFEQGTVEIPPLQIFRSIIPVFRNLIAFEQCRGPPDGEKDHVTAYACLMDFIIDTPRDVEMLDGIIVSTLGNDDEIARLFNSLSVHVSIASSSYLSGVYKSINDHCEQRWNRNMATLRHDYFSNPWARISVMAALVLFLLTTMQTVLAFLSYLNPT